MTEDMRIINEHAAKAGEQLSMMKEATYMFKQAFEENDTRVACAEVVKAVVKAHGEDHGPAYLIAAIQVLGTIQYEDATQRLSEIKDEGSTLHGHANTNQAILTAIRTLLDTTSLSGRSPGQ